MLAVLSSPVCPLQEEVLQQPLLGRILAFVRAQYRVRYAEVYDSRFDLCWELDPLRTRSMRLHCGVSPRFAGQSRSTVRSEYNTSRGRYSITGFRCYILPPIESWHQTLRIRGGLKPGVDSAQDPEAAVRAAVVEVTVTIAANQEALSGHQAPGDAPSNPLLRDVFDGLTDVNPCVQHTAAACLVQARGLFTCSTSSRGLQM